MKEKPKTSLIQLEIDGSIANVKLARPDKYNAMNVQMITELIEVFAWTAEHSVGSKGVLLSEDGTPYLRVLTLSGEGKHFCAGADINMMRDAGANTPEENRRDSERLDSLFNGLLVTSMFHNRHDTRGSLGWWSRSSCMFGSCCLQTRSKDCTI